MNRLFYDFHVHSCLSPCGDEDMTPYNIAGMGKLLGLEAMALTDHNSCRNCPPFFAACRAYGILPIAGMELTTAEDIHVVCLFEHLSDAMRFDSAVYSRLMPIQNKPEIFGRQLIMNEKDEVVEEESRLLISATDLSIEEVVPFVREAGGICYPAHIDRPSNGVTAILGELPEYLGFINCEVHDEENISPYRARYPAVSKCRILCSSDAHRLTELKEHAHFVEVEASQIESALRANLFRILSK